jgi:hypothetical protein
VGADVWRRRDQSGNSRAATERNAEGSVGRLRRSTSGADALDGLSVFVGRLDDCRELGELTQTALELLDDLFGIGSSMLLMADHDLKSLFVVVHHGYASGVGAEIAVDEGVIGVAAQRRRQVADSGGRSITFHDPDGTVLIDGDYIIRGVAGRILFAMLSEYQRSGRTRFSNRELRLNRDIGLPPGNDNLDARLVALRRRLAERGDPVQLQHAGRGQLELIVAAAVRVVRLERNDLKDLP